MARAYVAVEVDPEAEPRGWILTHASSGELIRQLRKDGFYANFKTVQELELYCTRLAKGIDTQATSTLDQPSLSSSKPKNSQGRRVGEPVDTATASVEGILKDKASLENLIVDQWTLFNKDNQSMPLTDVPYGETLNVPSTKDSVVSGYISGEQEAISTKVELWKLDLTVGEKLTIFVKTTGMVWMQLGKPQLVYEQSIKNLLLYIEMFSVSKKSCLLTSALLQLREKFDYWEVKPDVTDLRESILLMEKLNLTSKFPISQKLHSSIIPETGEMGESEAQHANNCLTSNDSKNLRTSTSNSNNASSSNSDNEKGKYKRTRNNRSSVSKSEGEQSDVNSSFNTEILQLIEDVHVPKKVKLNSAEHESRIINQTSIIDNGARNSVLAETSGSVNVDSDLDKIKKRIQKIQEEFSGEDFGSSKSQFSCKPFDIIEKLWVTTTAARKALEIIDQGGSIQEVEKICPRESLKDFYANQAALYQYGISRLLPAASKQKEVSERISYYAQDGDTLIQIRSLGVDYLSFLKERLVSLGKKCVCRNQVIDETNCVDTKEWKNANRLPTGSKLVVCLSFSLSLPGEQASKVIEFALELKPKLIVLISPVPSRRLEEQRSYSSIWVDKELLRNETMWPWGQLGVSLNDMEKDKGVPPFIYVWSRTDWTQKHRQIASQFGHVNRQSGSVSTSKC